MISFFRHLPILALSLALSGCAATSLPPQAYLDLREKAISEMQKGDYSQARSTIKDLLARFPGEPFQEDMELLLSDCEHKLGNRSEAIRLRKRVAKEAPSQDLKLQAWAGLGMMHLQDGRYAEAAACFREAEALEKAPEDRARRRYQTGLALQQGGKFPEAREEYQKAIDLAPGSDGAIRSKVQLLYPDHFTVQTGAFHEPANARRQADLLSGKGFQAKVIPMDFPSGKLHCVQVGKFSDRASATALLARIQAAKILPANAKIAVRP